jgi:hypothetical protein
VKDSRERYWKIEVEVSSFSKTRTKNLTVVDLPLLLKMIKVGKPSAHLMDEMLEAKAHHRFLAQFDTLVVAE